MVFFAIRDTIPAGEVPETFYQVRKRVGDIRHTLPTGIQGPYFNDEFGDTYTNIYALTGDGFGYRQLKEFGDRLRAELLRVPGVAKVDFIGEQDEKIFVELSNSKLATLGIEPAQIFATLTTQNAIAAAGVFDTAADRIYLRPSGAFASVEAIRDISIRANNRVFRLGDIATVSRAYADPPQQKMRFHGRETLGLGITMAKGGDVIELGHALDAEVKRVGALLPAGVEIEAVASMPKAVQRSVNDFVRSLAEAVIIVLAVSLVSLGLRTGLVVAISIPLVLAITFTCMWLFDIGLHKISLGALILSLGLLVDDAIIAVEMMAIKLEQGFDRFRAASFAYTSTAFPMLTGTLITVAGFLPIATARSGTGEYTRSIFQVSAIALIASWVVAVIVIPYLGYRMLPDQRQVRAPSLAARLLARLRGRGPAPAVPIDHEDPDAVYHTPFYRWLRGQVEWAVGHRAFVIGVTLAVFAASLALFRFIPQQFFPASARPELLVDLRLPEGSSFAATLVEAKKMEAVLDRDPGVASYVAYVGSGSPRFYLPLDQQLQQSNFAQFVLIAKDNREREQVRARLLTIFDDDFPALRGRISRLENGPPVGFPVQFRVSGEDIGRVRAIAGEVAAVMRRDPGTTNVQFDWDEPTKVVRLDIDQNKARLLGLIVAGCRRLPEQLGVGAHRHDVSRARQADRRRGPRRAGGARGAVVAQGPRGAVEERQGGADHADRRHPLRAGGGRRLAAQPAADGDRALRPARRRAGARRDRAHQSAARRAARRAAAGLPDRDRRRDRGLDEGPEVDRRRRAAAGAVGADAADAAAEELRRGRRWWC